MTKTLYTNRLALFVMKTDNYNPVSDSYNNHNNNSKGELITLVVDASGLAISKKGNYIEDKWKKEHREYLKLHIAVDIKSKQIISFRVTKDTVHDTKKFVPIIKERSKLHNITKV
ncbi:MAG: transposase [Nitrososphaeraceae archaeon]